MSFKPSQGRLDRITNHPQLKRTAGDLASFTEKTSLLNDDIFIIEDSAEANNKKSFKMKNLLAAIQATIT